MTYSVNDLKTVAECDQLLESFNRYRAELLAKQARLQFTVAKYTESTAEVDTETRMVLAELAFLDTILATLPEGPKKADYLNDRNRQETRLYQLETKKANTGVFALLCKQRELAVVEKNLSDTDQLIADLTARRAELVGGTD